ncbi:F0F1 ATP synthase subunit gamma [Nitrosospira sp. Is2]|uniref:F0F1 ATP synthase subunit gamma n=1 Tax=Nitrosospira sp. Is2 TaxID=3080532 RepID=UPI002952A453|nr:F0F1 ATP synthase subunit gamma [Nitrosospira sp. Is2]WON73884.1 F0F1 ATP synthase subunit gamma [Nitrosospira sp. Is2]
MSDTLANLRQKIDRARELGSVVSTMKALATANLVQYEKSARSLDDYYRVVQLGLSVCFRGRTPPATMAAPGAKEHAGVTGAIVFGSDQGLVGQFNDVVADYAGDTLASLPGRKKVWAIGERVHDRLGDMQLPLNGRFDVPLSIKGITPLVGELLLRIMVPGTLESVAQHKNGPENRLERLYLFYNRSDPGMAYEPVAERLLPLDETWRRSLAELPWPSKNLPEVAGDVASTLQALVREYLFVSLFRACAGSMASENASRLTAMERAERNIDELLEDLQKTFYRQRQSKIDEELFDVIAGVEALTGGQAGKRREYRQARAERTKE